MVQYRNTSLAFQRYVHRDEGRTVLVIQVPADCDLGLFRKIWKQANAEHWDFLVKPSGTGYTTGHRLVKEDTFNRIYRHPY